MDRLVVARDFAYLLHYPHRPTRWGWIMQPISKRTPCAESDQLRCVQGAIFDEGEQLYRRQQQFRDPYRRYDWYSRLCLEERQALIEYRRMLWDLGARSGAPGEQQCGGGSQVPVGLVAGGGGSRGRAERTRNKKKRRDSRPTHRPNGPVSAIRKS
jgi:hypothetical protein